MEVRHQRHELHRGGPDRRQSSGGHQRLDQLFGILGARWHRHLEDDAQEDPGAHLDRGHPQGADEDDRSAGKRYGTVLCPGRASPVHLGSLVGRL